MNSLESFAKFIPAANNSIIITNSPTSLILTDVESKSRRFTASLNESLYEVSNEPSIGFYRIQVGFSCLKLILSLEFNLHIQFKEHVRKSIPITIEKTNETDNFKTKLQGNSFDLDYSHDAVSRMTRADTTLDSISRLLTDSLYAARQLSIRIKSQNLEQTSPAGSILSRRKKQNKTTIGLDQKADNKVSSILSSISINDNLSTRPNANVVQKTTKKPQTMLITTNEIIEDQIDASVVEPKVEAISEETN